MNKKTFIVSSRNLTSGTKNNFTINTNFPENNYSRIKLLEASIPMSFSTASGNIIFTGDISGILTITIPPAKYDLNSLQIFIQNALSAKVGQVYIVSYTSTGFFTFSATENFSIDFSPTNAAAFGFNLNSPNAPTHTSLFSALSALRGDEFICVCSGDIYGIDNGTIIMQQNQIENHILAAIPTCCSGYVQFRNSNDTTDAFLVNKKIPKNFYLTFTNGSAVDLGGADWSIKVLLY